MTLQFRDAISKNAGPIRCYATSPCVKVSLNCNSRCFNFQVVPTCSSGTNGSTSPATSGSNFHVVLIQVTAVLHFGQHVFWNYLSQGSLIHWD